MTAAGSLGYDNLRTVAGRRRRVPGGSVLYFSLAAAPLTRVRVVAAVGIDGQPLAGLLEQAGADTSSLAFLTGTSYRWTADHGSGAGAPLRARQRFGVYQGWRPQLSAVARASQLFFLGSMHPRQQLQVLDQAAAPELVAADTMTDFVLSARADLEAVLARADLLFLNLSELEALQRAGGGGQERLALEAVARWRLRALVLKLGDRGTWLVDTDGIKAVPPADGPPVVDPTGAGDALAGGMLGRLAQLQRRDRDALLEALRWGTQAARRAISAFGPDALRP
ncbi:MAG: PfkB family carbohydrate kinase [Candidatus Dormibacteria bacterium]